MILATERWWPVVSVVWGSTSYNRKVSVKGMAKRSGSVNGNGRSLANFSLGAGSFTYDVPDNLKPEPPFDEPLKRKSHNARWRRLRNVWRVVGGLADLSGSTARWGSRPPGLYKAGRGGETSGMRGGLFLDGSVLRHEAQDAWRSTLASLPDFEADQARVSRRQIPPSSRKRSERSTGE